MPWIQLKINAHAQNAEQIGELLSESGAVAVTFQDAKDVPIFEPLPGETRLWLDTNVIALYNADSQMAPILQQLAQSPLLGSHFYHKIELLEDKDWQREWMDHFQPMSFGKRLWICPSWCPIPDEKAVNVMLDPGLAFGTGTHPTTALCLRWLDEHDLQGKTVIDFGCGSGILAIAALKLGAKQAIGIDIDSQAILASRDNAERNGVAERLTLYLSEQMPDNLQADIVIANILAGPLRELKSTLTHLVKSEGALVLSGILSEQAPAVVNAYQSHFALAPVKEKEEWCRIEGIKSINR